MADRESISTTRATASVNTPTQESSIRFAAPEESNPYWRPVGVDGPPTSDDPAGHGEGSSTQPVSSQLVPPSHGESSQTRAPSGSGRLRTLVKRMKNNIVSTKTPKTKISEDEKMMNDFQKWLENTVRARAPTTRKDAAQAAWCVLNGHSIENMQGNRWTTYSQMTRDTLLNLSRAYPRRETQEDDWTLVQRWQPRIDWSPRDNWLSREMAGAPFEETRAVLRLATKLSDPELRTYLSSFYPRMLPGDSS